MDVSLALCSLLHKTHEGTEVEAVKLEAYCYQCLKFRQAAFKYGTLICTTCGKTHPLKDMHGKPNGGLYGHQKAPTMGV